MSPKMEDLQNFLFLDRVPSSWSKLAYPSLRALAPWLSNLLDRAQQLQTWTEEPTAIPNVTNLSYFFNPQSFLTAIMQRTAQLQKLELDKLCVLTEITRRNAEQTETKAREGAYVTGLYVEGARWNWAAGLLEVFFFLFFAFFFVFCFCHKTKANKQQSHQLIFCCLLCNRKLSLVRCSLRCLSFSVKLS